MEIRLARSLWSKLFMFLPFIVHVVSCCGSVLAEVGYPRNLEFCKINHSTRFTEPQSPPELSFDEDSLGSITKQEASKLITSPNHEIRLSPNKGLGLFATRPLSAGALILVEAPLFSVPVPEMVPNVGFRITDMLTSLTTSFQGLSPSDQAKFLSLHDHRFPSEALQSHLITIFRSNAYNTGSDRIGLFPKTARINHSCRPNAGNWWSESTGKRIIYANRDIRAGEEITVSYIPLLKTREERQERLAQYGFICGCEACSEGDTGDRRRKRIKSTFEELEGKLGNTSLKEGINEKRVAKARALVNMVEGEGLWDYVARTYRFAAVFCKQAGLWEEARGWAEKERMVLGWAEVESEEWVTNQSFISSLEDR